MSQTANTKFEFIKQNLQVIALQNMALQTQISSFNETLHHTSPQFNSSQQILKNTLETILKSRKITELINVCRSQLEPFLPQNTQIQSQSPHPFFPSQNNHELSGLSSLKNEQAFSTETQPTLKNPIEAISFYLPKTAETNFNDSKDYLNSTELTNSCHRTDFLLVTLGTTVTPIESFFPNKRLYNPLDDPLLSQSKPVHIPSSLKVSFEPQNYQEFSLSNFSNCNFQPFERKTEHLSVFHKSDLQKLQPALANSLKKPSPNFPVSPIFYNDKTLPVLETHSLMTDPFENLPLDKICEADYPKYRQMFQDHLLRRKRGKYKICTSQMKEQIVRICQNHSLKTAAEIFSVPEKNIKRWITQGPERKKGAGRKTMDPQMEAGLLNWISEYFRVSNVFPDFKEIKLQAKRFTKNQNFMASKGWCDKFMKRNILFFQQLKERV